ncbi:Integrase core domain protein (plasmid) [Piscirickettsia salmonis]|uniref:IS6 family transposase n=1 Tax=Piscirickettsia salmonis TaxID=1238 RepID=UPI0012D9A780|nr:Integrase core domain protein [Piscirickettsia salmonis]QGP61880.1 Integrase core domain protein [Piscirickettsia salmonis]QGP66503.1 Integrase core domain protein [Piscirickettsia salmonis]
MARRKRFKKNQPFKWKHYSGEIILWLVCWYGRYALSYRDLKEMTGERGLELERSTICRWVHEYGPEIAKRLRPHFRQTCASWRLDETLVKIKGRWYYLYRAIDKYGHTLDWMLSRQQNAKAALRFFKKAIAQPYVKSPRVVNVDKHASFPPAHQKAKRKRRYLGRYFAHPMMQNRRAKRDDYKSSAVRVTQRYVP